MSVFDVTDEDSENIKRDFRNNICYSCGEKVVYLFQDGRCKSCTLMLPEEIICYNCGETVVYLFQDGRCKSCTRMLPEEVIGESS